LPSGRPDFGCGRWRCCPPAAEAAGGTFTKNDVNFLRSLRISIEGEDNDELTQGDDEEQAG